MRRRGFNYHGARYYAPWLGRWTACDPVGIVDAPSLYVYVRNRPTCLNDPNGRQSYNTQPYNQGGGDHVHQVGARTSGAGSNRGQAAQYGKAPAIPTKNNPTYNDRAGQAVEGAINRAAWGRSGTITVRGTARVTITSSGDFTVGQPGQPPTPAQSPEDQKAYFKQRAAGVSPDQALDNVTKSRNHLQGTGATPTRVPQPPRGTPAADFAAQTLSPEIPLQDVVKNLPPSSDGAPPPTAPPPTVLPNAQANSPAPTKTPHYNAPKTGLANPDEAGFVSGQLAKDAAELVGPALLFVGMASSVREEKDLGAYATLAIAAKVFGAFPVTFLTTFFATDDHLYDELGGGFRQIK